MHTQADSALVSSIDAALRAVAGVQAADIYATVENGKVELKGKVDDPLLHQRVLDAVRMVPGVVSVDDDLHTRTHDSESMGQYVDDAGITASVKAKLLGEKGISSLKIHVETNHGVVTLTGEAESHDKAMLAERVTKMVDGVRQVNNHIVIEA